MVVVATLMVWFPRPGYIAAHLTLLFRAPIERSVDRSARAEQLQDITQQISVHKYLVVILPPSTRRSPQALVSRSRVWLASARVAPATATRRQKSEYFASRVSVFYQSFNHSLEFCAPTFSVLCHNSSKPVCKLCRKTQHLIRNFIVHKRCDCSAKEHSNHYRGYQCHKKYRANRRNPENVRSKPLPLCQRSEKYKGARVKNTKCSDLLVWTNL